MKKSLGARTILYPTPVLIVGTYDKAGKPNAMACAWGGICDLVDAPYVAEFPVRKGVRDPDFDIPIGGWQGRIEEGEVGDDGTWLYEVAWDSVTCGG